MGDKLRVWKTLKTQILFSHDYLGIAEDQVRLPDGTTTTYIRHTPARHHSVIVIAVNTKHQVLVQRE